MTEGTNKLPERRLLARAALAILAVSLVVAVGAADRAEGGSTKADREDAVEPFAGDVFVVAGGQFRNPTFQTSPDAQLFNVAGTQLGVTWGRWQDASVTAKVRIGGKRATPRTDVRVRLSGLVPGGVYSLFYATFGPDSRHPLCPGAERTLPLVSRDRDQAPDPSSFVADAGGRADFRARVDGRLLDATQAL